MPLPALHAALLRSEHVITKNSIDDQDASHVTISNLIQVKLSSHCRDDPRVLMFMPRIHSIPENYQTTRGTNIDISVSLLSIVPINIQSHSFLESRAQQHASTHG